MQTECPGNLIALLLSAVSQSLACLCMSHSVTHFGGQYLVLQVIESQWVFHLPLDEDNKAVYIHFEVSICSEVPTSPISAVSKPRWFPRYNRKPFEGLTSLKYITQLKWALFYSSVLAYGATGLVVSAWASWRDTQGLRQSLTCVRCDSCHAQLNWQNSCSYKSWAH